MFSSAKEMISDTGNRPSSTDPSEPTPAKETLMRTTGGFSATRAGELSVHKGEVLAVVPETREENGWRRMSRGEESGWVTQGIDGRGDLGTIINP